MACFYRVLWKGRLVEDIIIFKGRLFDLKRTVVMPIESKEMFGYALINNEEVQLIWNQAHQVWHEPSIRAADIHHEMLLQAAGQLSLV